MDETTLTNADQRIQAWYNVYDLCLSLGMDVTDKTGEQAVLDFIARIQELETAIGKIREKAIIEQGEFACVFTENLPNNILPIREIEKISTAALLNNTPLEKE